jgi:hypothetical protein
MSTTTVSPLRQRMIEDMSLRNLAPRTQEAYPWLQEAGSVLAPLARHGDRRGHPALSAASRRAGGEHLQPQPYDDWRGFPVPSDAATA